MADMMSAQRLVDFESIASSNFLFDPDPGDGGFTVWSEFESEINLLLTFVKSDARFLAMSFQTWLISVGTKCRWPSFGHACPHHRAGHCKRSRRGAGET